MSNNKKLYVGNLSYGMKDQDLSDLFSQYGEVTSAQIITFRDTGRSKGFGFVEMATDEAATEAVSKLDGSEQDGRNIRVNVAQPKERRDDRGGRGGHGGHRGDRGGYRGDRGNRY